MIIRHPGHPGHPNHLSQDLDSISRTFLEQFALVYDLGSGGVEGKEEEEKRKCPCDRTGV